MDAKKIMEQILQSGKELAEQGKEFASEAVGLPEKDGSERDAMVSGIGKGAAVGGILALLLGTRWGRRLSGKALKYGTLAALGTVAFKTYQNYKNAQGEDVENSGQSIGELDDAAAEKRSTMLLKAMVAAAKSDGHIDEEEQKIIRTKLEQLDLNESALNLILSEVEKGIDVAQLAKEVDSPSAAAEVYLASRMVLDVKNITERAYLDSLARALDLSEELVEKLEAEV